MLTALAIGAGVVAGGAVRATATRARTRRLWWAAAVAAAGAAAIICACGAPVPVAGALVAAALAAAAVVDACEGRIPTPIAYGAAAASTAGVLVHGHLSGDWPAVAGTLGLTAVLCATCATLWVAGAAGFGDVRLSTGTALAMLGGPPALALFAWIAAAAAGGLAAVRRVAGGASTGAVGPTPRRPVPLAPPLAIAWLATLVLG